MSRVLYWWLMAVNAAAALLVALDKVQARHGGRRVPERMLLLFGALGGAPLMLAAMLLCHHKTKKPKLPFPQSWAGQPQEVIEQKSGIPGISFCHASRFLITAKDKETALAACRQVLKNNGRL